ncbi:MAG: hypothetical protein ACXVUE_09890 [Solirubrobacteraceae bacterium]
MRILLGFENLTVFGGTETYNLTLARELERLGHDAAIYSPNHGEMAEYARSEGISVLTSVQLPTICDLVIASDAATCYELAGRYPDAPAVMVAHSADHMLQAPPQLTESCAGVIVLNDRVRRAVEARAWHAPILRLRQPLALDRYYSVGACRATAQTALVTTNYVDGPRRHVIEAACRANRLRVNWIGATTKSTATPELAIADADLVIGLGRGTLEAMAAGRAAYVYGVVGGDGWVTPEDYAAMEADGFAGTAFSDRHIDVDRMTADLGEWTETMGEYNRDLASAHHSVREHAIALLGFVRDLSPAPAPPSTSDEFARLIRLNWRMERRAVENEREAARLRAELAGRDRALADRDRALAERDRRVGVLHEQLVARQAEFDLLRGTRRYRLAARLAAPLDRWRNGRGH